MNNTVVRTLSGIVFIGIMVGAILLSRYTFITLTTAIIVLGMLEFYRMTVPKAGKLHILLAVLSGVLLNLSLFFEQNYWMSLSAVAYILLGLSVMAVFIAPLYTKAEKPFEHIGYLITGIVYIALPFAIMNYLVAGDFDSANFPNTVVKYRGDIILAYFIMLWANDVGAYCFGITLGRNGKHKLFPRHSPKKSWEGFIGGVIMSMLAGYLISLFSDLSSCVLIGMGLIISVFGTLGDLVESMLKRSVGVKDSGNIMPGHGGILDRFDGVLLSIVPVFLYLYILLLLRQDYIF